MNHEPTGQIAEVEGQAVWSLVGKIQLLQEMMGGPVSTNAELATLGIPALTVLLGELQDRYRRQ